MRTLTKVAMAALGLLGAAPCAADITDTGARFDDSPKFILSEFTLDHSNQLCIWTTGSEDEYNVQLFDGNLQPIKNIELPAPGSVIYCSFTEETGISAPAEVFEANRSIDYAWTDISLEDFRNLVYDWGYQREEQHGDEIWFISDNGTGNFFMWEIFGYKYPYNPYIYNVSERKGGYAHIYWEGKDFQFTGKYREPVTVNEGRHSSAIVKLYPTSQICDDYSTLLVSQCLFNTDAAYEWLQTVVEPVTLDIETPAKRIKGERALVTGYKVMSDNGKTVAEIKLPHGLSGDSWSVDLYMMDNGNNYLCIQCDDFMTEERVYIFYQVNSETGSVQQMGAPVKVGVSPTAPRRGTPVSVDLGAVQGMCTVELVASDGRVVSRQRTAGDKAVIETGSLASGLYIVMVNDGKSTREATKIVVR